MEISVFGDIPTDVPFVSRTLSEISRLSIIAVLFLAMAKEPYATTVMFLLLLIKGGLFYRQAKVG